MAAKGCSFWLAVFAALGFSQAIGETALNPDLSLTTHGAPAINANVTEACLDQDKPPCIIRTDYLPRVDGTNDFKIVLAYVAMDPKTNAQGQEYHNVGMLPGELDEKSPGFAALPSGFNVALHKGVWPRGKGQLVSIEKLAQRTFVLSKPWTNPPIINVDKPAETVTSHPVIKISGSSDHPLHSVHYDVLNATAQTRNAQGYVTDTYFDTSLWKTTTNYWECVEVHLAPGTNLFVLRCEDDEGRTTTNRVIYSLQFDKTKTPPKILLDWPPEGAQVSGSAFSARGHIDDISTVIVGRITGGGQSATINGLVERTGGFWLEHLPVFAKTNELTVVATDAAGNVSTKVMRIIRSDTDLVINPVPLNQLYQLQVAVTGTVRPPKQQVWVNGRTAKVEQDGTWRATGVPVNPDGCAIFHATATLDSKPMLVMPPQNIPNIQSVTPSESVSLQSALTTAVLNITQPTYGSVNIHITGTSGKSFILLSSTNLTEWTPIQTNRNSSESFDYIDTNSIAYGCRFFRIAPIR